MINTIAEGMFEVTRYFNLLADESVIESMAVIKKKRMKQCFIRFQKYLSAIIRYLVYHHFNGSSI